MCSECEVGVVRLEPGKYTRFMSDQVVNAQLDFLVISVPEDAFNIQSQSSRHLAVISIPILVISVATLAIYFYRTVDCSRFLVKEATRQVVHLRFCCAREKR
ncbi:hypothetical protein CPSG_04340 [Coccidioides posadasii str. Silveira]|uniref:Uncharacterized protein n=1 Tax=Coccidioides posadasii (strain RMSCC 757 / Silveira) TaxID=443226 RepID=E9D401_COCPS|nr:hypothetical protein CPSG_04340 [Coccidioides posadasii str. Silveira]